MALAGLGIVLGGCGAERRGPATPVRIGYASGFTTASLWIAAQSGYFSAQDVRIDWHRMDRPSTALPQLAAGHFDVMSLHATAPLFNLIARGERIRIVADRGHHPPGGCATGAFLLRRDLDPESLPRRLRTGVGPGRLAEFMLDRLRTSLGMDGLEWELLDLPADMETHALAGGGIDVGAMSEPALSRALDEGVARIWRTYGDVYPFVQHTMLVFGPRLVDRERDLGSRFLTAYLRAERDLARGKTDENVARMAEALDFDPALTRRLCWPPVRSDLAVNDESLADFQRWALGKGWLDRVVPPEEYWDGTFAAAAIAGLHRQAMQTTAPNGSGD